jgi:mRNA-degrading endonuclease toxin of MazEF toxin-antitoxin module
MIVLSDDAYHRSTSDAILGVVTGNVSRPEGDTDFRLSDWAQAGLSKPSVFRTFLVTRPISGASRPIGRLSEADWVAVSMRVRTALAAILKSR